MSVRNLDVSNAHSGKTSLVCKSPPPALHPMKVFSPKFPHQFSLVFMLQTKSQFVLHTRPRLNCCLIYQTKLLVKQLKWAWLRRTAEGIVGDRTAGSSRRLHSVCHLLSRFRDKESLLFQTRFFSSSAQKQSLSSAPELRMNLTV